MPASRSDLVELILDPLSAQIDRARLEILQKVEAVDESAEAIAGQMRRQLDGE